MPHDSWQELQAYLVDEFTLDLVPGGAGIENDVIARKGREYYLRRSRERLYCETARALDYLRDPYFQCIREAASPCEVLDYECGIGSNGLRLAAMGYTPAFTDEPGICVDYLKWRLQWRGVEARIYKLKDAPRADLVVCLTTLDQMPPLERLAELGRVVALGLGPLLPDKVNDLAQGLKMQIADAYRLTHSTIFNANWLFIAFETPEPRAQEEIDG
ncbi:MAG: hypothetical protein ABIG44_00830 [Planctomycetota bacterium]